MAAYLPARITPALTTERQPGNAGYGTGGGGAFNPLLIDQVGPVEAVPGLLFIPMGPRLFNGYVQFFVSSDNGATWAADSSGVQQACRNWCASWDAASGLFTVAYLANSNAGGLNPILVRQYNPVTQTWAAALAPGQSTTAVLSVATRSNGDILVGHAPVTVNAVYGMSVYSSGAWSDFTLDTTPNYIVNVAALTMVVDAADTAHIIIATGGQGLAGSAYFYRQFLADNTEPWTLDNRLMPYPGVGLPLYLAFGAGNVALNQSQGYLIQPFLYQATGTEGTQLRVSIITGLGTSNTIELPVVLLDTGNDYIAATNGTQFQGPVVRIPGDGFIHITLTSVTPSNQTWDFTIEESNPGGTYTQRLVLDSSDTDPAVDTVTDGLIAVLPDGSTSLIFNAVATGSGLNGRYLLGVAAPVSTPTIKITLRGIKRTRCNPDLDVREVPAGIPSRGRAM